MYVQQGDVLLKKTVKAPLKSEMIKSDLLHKGRNHHHRLRGGFRILKYREDIFVKSTGNVVLFHEEHKDVKLPRGTYKLALVQEYDHLKEEARAVID